MSLSEHDKAELVAYLDGELDEQATQAIEAKLATDSEARAELDSLKQTWGMLDYLPKASASPNFTNRTMERLTLEKVGASTQSGSGMSSRPTTATPPRSAWKAAGWAAVVLLALGSGFLVGPRLFPAKPTPGPVEQESDEALIRNLRIVEKWRFYENVDDRQFIEDLRQPELFGDEPG